jgi:hypothetical protein
MAVWLELLALSLFSYAAGFAVGWSLWHRTGEDEQ